MESSLQKKILAFFESNAFREEVRPEHLAPSGLCDLGHPRLQALYSKLVGNLSEPEKIANRLYDFLRAEILYEFDEWAVKASDTADRARGMCFNKSNLLVALLRLSGIPCVYSLFWIGKGGFQFTAEESMRAKIQPRTVHAYVEAYLGESKGWRRYVDTSLDVRLRRVLIRQGYEPFQNILNELPIERFASAEEVLDWRRRYKESIGAEESITREEREKSNRRLEALRENGAV